MARSYEALYADVARARAPWFLGKFELVKRALAEWRARRLQDAKAGETAA
jgi:hypothetical protein